MNAGIDVDEGKIELEFEFDDRYFPGLGGGLGGGDAIVLITPFKCAWIEFCAWLRMPSTEPNGRAMFEAWKEFTDTGLVYGIEC